jgi:predicted DNA-binding transcriptional regulator AlpA
MKNNSEWEPLDVSRFQVLPIPEAGALLTAAQVCRRLAYSPAQLYFLAQQYGLPIPIDFAPRVALWSADEIEEWRRWRDETLGLQIV